MTGERVYPQYPLQAGLLQPSENAPPKDSSRPTVTTQRFYFNGVNTSLINREGSLSREKLERFLVPNSLVARDYQGRIYPITAENGEIYLEDVKVCDLEPDSNSGISEDGNSLLSVVPDSFRHQPLSNLHDMWVVPAKRYGELHVMQVHVPGDVANWIDIKRPQRDRMLEDLAWWTREFKDTRGQVCVGGNISYPCMDGRGLMSIMAVHNHVWTDPALAVLDYERIVSDRALPRKDNEKVEGWDEGLSFDIGKIVEEELNKKILPHYQYNGYAQADELGVVTRLPEFTPEELMQERYPGFKTWLSLLNHRLLTERHEEYFDSRFDECVREVIDAHSDNRAYNRDRHKGYFARKDLNGFSNGEIAAMKKLDDNGILREGFGWSWGINFGPDGGATIAITYGLANRSFGPVESLGVELRRDDNKVTGTDFNQLTQQYQALANKYLASH